MVFLPFTKRLRFARVFLCRTQVTPCYGSLSTLLMPFCVVLGRLSSIKMIRLIIYKAMHFVSIRV